MTSGSDLEACTVPYDNTSKCCQALLLYIYEYDNTSFRVNTLFLHFSIENTKLSAGEGGRGWLVLWQFCLLQVPQQVICLLPIEHKVPGEHCGDAGDLLFLVHDVVTWYVRLEVKSNFP